MLGYVTGWIAKEKKINKKGKMRNVGGKKLRVFIIIVPGHNNDKMVQLLSVSSNKLELYQKLLRKFDGQEFPTFDHNIERGVFCVFKRGPAVYYAKDGHAAPIERYNEYCGFNDTITYRSDMSKNIHWRSGKKSTMFGLKLLRYLTEADGDIISKVTFKYEKHLYYSKTNFLYIV